MCPSCSKKRDTQQPHRALYRTGRWKTTSKRWLARNPWCRGFPVGCHGSVGRLATVTDHIVSARVRPDLFWDENSNYQSLCDDCHRAKTNALENGLGHARP
jgi:5-methylcytosine-specific restriction endonuclease McrA